MPPPVITLVFAGGLRLTIVDNPDPNGETDEILTSGGVHRFACFGVHGSTPWTPVPATSVTRTG